MSRNLFIVVTLAFWMAVAGLALTAAWWAPSPGQAPPKADGSIGLVELAAHATPDNCWMAIRGTVYDVTDYLPDHPSRADIIEAWCGREATDAYDTKMKDRPHSRLADELLPRYRVGPL
jgi:hypothetical protein